MLRFLGYAIALDFIFELFMYHAVDRISNKTGPDQTVWLLSILSDALVLVAHVKVMFAQDSNIRPY